MNQFQSLDEVLAALKRRAFLIILITGIGCVFSLNYALGQIKIYEATSVIQIEGSQIPSTLAGSSAPTTDAGLRLRLIEQRLMARDNLLGIMEKHNLFADDPTMAVNERIFMLREAARIEQIVNGAQSWQPNSTPSGLIINVRLSDPEKAAAVANDLMYSVVEQSRERSLTRAQGTLEFFEIEAARVVDEIAEVEATISQFKRENVQVLPAGVGDLRTELASLRESVLETEQEIVTLRNNAARVRDNVLETQIALLQEQRRLFESRIATIETLLSQAPEVERQLSILERDLEQLQEQYSVITRRKAEAEMGQLLEDREQSERFEILETALVPEYPVSRSRKKTAVMGGVASIILGIAVAFLIEILNPALRTAAQMERQLGLQPVITIPTIQTRSETRNRRIKWLAGGLALLAAAFFALPSLLRIAQDRFGDIGLLSWFSAQRP